MEEGSCEVWARGVVCRILDVSEVERSGWCGRMNDRTKRVDASRVVHCGRTRVWVQDGNKRHAMIADRYGTAEHGGAVDAVFNVSGVTLLHKIHSERTG